MKERMLMNIRKLFVLPIAAALLLALAVMAGAQEKKKESLDRVSGTVQMISKDTKTITVRASSGNVQRQVLYDENTKFTKQNKPGGSIDDVKEGTRIICLGKFNEKTQLVATRIDIRLPR
jgi:hypothetical protein